MQKQGRIFGGRQGFTIIELLVVVSIIAILTGIVLSNVTQYVNRGKDSSAKGDLASMITNGAVYYDTNNTYTDFYSGTTSPITTLAGCTGSPGFTGPCMALINTGYTSITFTCGGAANCQTAGVTSWCAMITQKTNANTFCVDSSGAKIDKSGGTCSSGICG